MIMVIADAFKNGHCIKTEFFMVDATSHGDAIKMVKERCRYEGYDWKYNASDANEVMLIDVIEQ